MDDCRGLFKLLKVILVMASVYWLFLMFIVPCVLFGRYPSASNEPEVSGLVICVLFVILSIVGGVLAVLLVVVHFASKQHSREFDYLPRGKARGAGQPSHGYRDYPDPGDLEWGMPPLISLNEHFQRLTNLDTLVPLLCAHGILQTFELESLLEYSRRFDKISFLLTVLDRKGRDGVKGVIRCLKKDKEHIGHKDLASILERQYPRHYYCNVLHLRQH